MRAIETDEVNGPIVPFRLRSLFVAGVLPDCSDGLEQSNADTPISNYKLLRPG